MNNSASHSLADTLSRAFAGLDARGRVAAELAAELRRRVRELPREFRTSVGYVPEQSLGPFESLSASARQGLIEAIASDDHWSVRGRELPGHAQLLLLLWTLRAVVRDRIGVGSKLARAVNEALSILCYAARRGPADLLRAGYHSQLGWQGRMRPRPSIPAILGLAGIEPKDLAVCYARGIPQLPRYRGFWRDPTRHIAVGSLIGVDLLPREDGYWIIECNMDAGLRPERSALYESDPLVGNLLDLAARGEYRHLVFVSNDSDGFNSIMAGQLEEGARARRLKLTIVENVTVPRSKYTRYYGIPNPDEAGTLVVRVMRYPTSIDYLFDAKPAHNRALTLYQQQRGDPDLRLPGTSPEPILANIAPADPFPNLVYKASQLDAARGVYFLKATSQDHARALAVEVRALLPQNILSRVEARLIHLLVSQRGIFQPYLKSSLLRDRRLYIVRAHVFLAPGHIAFLSAHRVVAGQPVPTHLEPGIVCDPSPYLVNFSSGGYYRLVPSSEQPAVIKAAMAAGRGLAWAAEYGFETG